MEKLTDFFEIFPEALLSKGTGFSEIEARSETHSVQYDTINMSLAVENIGSTDHGSTGVNTDRLRLN